METDIQCIKIDIENPSDTPTEIKVDEVKYCQYAGIYHFILKLTAVKYNFNYQL